MCAGPADGVVTQRGLDPHRFPSLGTLNPTGALGLGALCCSACPRHKVDAQARNKTSRSWAGRAAAGCRDSGFVRKE